MYHNYTYGKRELDLNKVQAYIEAFQTPEDRKFALSILGTTRYVPWSEFVDKLNASCDAFCKNIGNTPFYVYLPTDKFGSEIVFTVLLWPKIRSLNFQGFIDLTTKLQHGDHVFVADDAIYTGIHITSIIDNLTFENPNTTINFHVVVPYVSRNGEQQILAPLSPNQNPVINMYPQVYTVNLSLSEQEDLMNRFNVELPYAVPLYFDHKVGNNFASFPSIYMLGVVPNKTEFGCLIGYPPDTQIKHRMYQQYFQHLLPPPSLN